MSKKRIAMEGAGLAIVGGDTVASGGTIEVTPGQANISKRINLGGKGVFVEKMDCTIAGFTSSDLCVQDAPVNTSIQGTCNRIQIGKKFLVQEGDTSPVVTISGKRGQQVCTFTVQVTVEDPAQDRIIIETPDVP